MPNYTPEYDHRTGFTANHPANNEQRIRNQLESRRKDLYNNRRGLQNKILNSKPNPHHDGAVGKVRQMNSYNAEAVSGELLADLLILAFTMFFNTPYLHKLLVHQMNLSAELQAKLQGRELRLIYEMDDYGNYPEVFPLNGKGEPDFSAEPLHHSQVTEELARRNGYSIPPRSDVLGIISDMLIGYKTAMDGHIETMLGPNAIDELAKLRLHGTVGVQSGNSDQNPDPNAVNMMMNRPRPVPVRG